MGEVGGLSEAEATWSRMPLVAPAWLWIAYHLGMIALAFIAMHGGLGAAFAVMAATGFSFQFWTFAAWRGYVRTTTPRAATNAERPADGNAT